MKLTQILREEAEHTYAVTESLFRMVDGADLDWKPPTGKNWMTLGQLLNHCATACGGGLKGFLTGDWGLPEGKTLQDLPPEQMLPPAEALPSVDSVAKALALLVEDKALALRSLDQAAEEKLLGSRFPAPWGGPGLTLFQHLLQMIEHLQIHKAQLFYYLKLLGRDVATPQLWGV